MSEESIFSPDQGEQAAEAPKQEASTEATTPSTQPSIPTELQEFVGEGKKFKTVADYVNGYKNSQEFIETLKSESQQQRDELSKRKAAEELLQEMKQSNTSQQTPTSQGVEVNEAILSEIVEKKLQQQTQKQQHESNAKSVVQAFAGSYGEKAEAMYDKIANESGFTRAQMNQLASTNPKAVLKLAGLSQASKPASTGFISSDVNTTSLSTNPNEAPLHARVANYGSSKDITDAMRRAGEIVNKRLNIS
jgi:hypothetical protein